MVQGPETASFPKFDPFLPEYGFFRPFFFADIALNALGYDIVFVQGPLLEERLGC